MRTCEDGCNGCDELTDWDEPAGLTDPTVKPDIAALKKRLAEDPAFAAQVTGDRRLRRVVSYERRKTPNADVTGKPPRGAAEAR